MTWAIGLAALLAGIWTAFVFFANGMRSSSGKFVGAGMIWAAWLTVLIFAFMAFGGKAKAHENPTDWIGQEKRTNAAGVLCCGKGDCFPFTVDQIRVMPDGYHFPDGRVAAFITAAPSVDGFYWRCEWGNEVKCIFAPMGGT